MDPFFYYEDEEELAQPSTSKKSLTDKSATDTSTTRTNIPIKVVNNNPQKFSKITDYEQYT